MHPCTLKPISKAPKLATLPLDIPNQDTLPITLLIDPRASTPPTSLPKDQLLFCYKALLNTIDSLLAKRYTDFDGHTTANCCHGIALLTWHLIFVGLDTPLLDLKEQFAQTVQHLEQHDCTTTIQCTEQASKELINLACLRLLYMTKDSDPHKGGRTITKKLKDIFPISVNICNHISHSLKKIFANWVSTSYSFYFENLEKEMHISDISVNLWGKYIDPSFLRVDKRGVKYASNLFSTQIVLAYLSQNKAKIAIVNDIQNSSNTITSRYACLFEGDGNGGFYPISKCSLAQLQETDQDEPVIILGGCVYSDTIDHDSLNLKMQPWQNKLSHLMLACDVFYPQFFRVKDDPDFDHSPIIPEETHLQDIMSSLSIYGTHAKNPSLYCSTHIQLSSLHQFLKVSNRQDITALPFFFIPSVQTEIKST